MAPFRPKSGVVIHTSDSEAQAAMAAGEAGEEREGSRDFLPGGEMMGGALISPSFTL